MKQQLTILSVVFLLALSARPDIVLSANYTEETGTNQEVNFNTLKLDGNALVDWMIYDDLATGGVYTESATGTLIQTPIAADQGAPDDLAYNFTWSGGTSPNTAGTDVPNLGETGAGVFQFDVAVPVDFAGIFRLYVGAKKEDTYMVTSFYSGDSREVLVGAGTHGFIDIAYENNNFFAETIRVQMISSISQEASFYGSAVAQIPEPTTIGLVSLLGLGTLIARRIFG